MDARDFIRPRSENGEDNLVDLIYNYLLKVTTAEQAKDFYNHKDIKVVVDANYNIQKFAINRYFRNLLVEEAGSRMKIVDGLMSSELDIRVPLLNIQINVPNLDWYNLIVSGVIKFILDNEIKLKWNNIRI